MRKLRWAMDGGGFWDLDVSTPRTLDGLARPVPGDPLPLGLSRGTRLSRPNQIDFFQRFMASPFVPSYSPSRGFLLERVLTLPFGDSGFASLLGQFNLQKFVSSVQGREESNESTFSWFNKIGRHLRDQSLYALGLSFDLLLTPDDKFLVSLDTYGDNRFPRKKAILHHKFPNHDLTVEALSPGLFVDNKGNYWDVPFSVAVDLASIASDSGASYHLSMHHNAGSPSPFEGETASAAPATLLPGLSIKSAFSFKKNFDFWRSNAQKLRLVQPYDIFLSDPHISASGTIGAAMTTCFGDSSARSQALDDPQKIEGLYLQSPGMKSAFLADIFGSVTFSAQYGYFQRFFLDLTRFHTRMDFPSGSKFLSGATCVVEDLFNFQQPKDKAIKAIIPNTTLSIQQQIAGPVSLRVETGVGFELKNQEWGVKLELDETVVALEYALQVLGSAKAIAWYSPKHKEFMVELRFFET